MAPMQVAQILRDGAGSQFDEHISSELATIVELQRASPLLIQEPVNSEPLDDVMVDRSIASYGMVFWDPDIPGDRYRQSRLTACLHALADGLIPAIVIRRSASDADLSWLTIRNAEIWAPPMSVIRGTSIRPFRYVDSPDGTRIMNDDGNVHVQAAHMPEDAFRWRGMSRIRAAMPVVGIVAVIAVFVIATGRSVLRVSQVRTSDMSPTITCGAYSIDVPTTRASIGDVVVIATPRSLHQLDWSAPKRIVSRVVGSEGDIIHATRDTIVVNGSNVFGGRATPMRNDYASRTWRLAHNQFFVLGDRRNGATDSRLFGPISASDLEGKVIAVAWPSKNRGTLSDLPSSGQARDCGHAN